MRRKKFLEKQAEEEGLTPTKDLQVDESGLEEEDKPHFELPLSALIVFGVLIVIIIVCVIVIYANGGPINK